MNTVPFHPSRDRSIRCHRFSVITTATAFSVYCVLLFCVLLPFIRRFSFGISRSREERHAHYNCVHPHFPFEMKNSKAKFRSYKRHRPVCEPRQVVWKRGTTRESIGISTDSGSQRIPFVVYPRCWQRTGNRMHNVEKSYFVNEKIAKMITFEIRS